jgi:hypothetical protein
MLTMEFYSIYYTILYYYYEPCKHFIELKKVDTEEFVLYNSNI